MSLLRRERGPLSHSYQVPYELLSRPYEQTIFRDRIVLILGLAVGTSNVAPAALTGASASGPTSAFVTAAHRRARDDDCPRSAQVASPTSLGTRTFAERLREEPDD